MLFYIDKNDKTVLRNIRLKTLKELDWLEKHLENLVANHIDRIVREDQLLVIHQQIQFQEHHDILALDKDGTLHIFELKRWPANQENLLQVLRYGQKFGQYDYTALDLLFQKYLERVGKGTRKSLADAHMQYFENSEKLKESSFNQRQQFIIITNGLDRQTREAIIYWGKHHLPVTALIYKVYETTNHDLLLFEIRPYGPEGDTFVETPEGLIVVNTNVQYRPDAWRDMLDGNKASAYRGRKTTVCSIQIGSPIALYHTGVGIIAFGKTTGTFGIIRDGDDEEGEYYVPCNFETKVNPIDEPDKAVTAREINEFLDASHRFRMSVYTLPGEAGDFVRDSLKKKKSSLQPQRQSG